MSAHWLEVLKAVVCSMPLGPLALAALPPLSGPVRTQHAQLVAVGRVEKLEQREVQVPGGSDLAFTAVLAVTRIEKELRVSHARTLTFHFRRIGKRPSGWTGPTGQSAIPELHQAIRIYGHEDPSGELILLEPNGWEPAS